MSMLRLCSLDPPKYGWTACGGIASILEPHEAARRQDAKERFFKRQREAASAAAVKKKTAEEGDNDNEDDKKASSEDVPEKTTTAKDESAKYYTIIEPSVETQKPAAASANADGPTTPTKKTDKDASAETSAAAAEASPKKDPPPKKIEIHSKTIMSELDIYTYHRGRVGQEPRHPRTGELLCDTDPIDTNHCWIPPSTTVARVVIKFPLGDMDEEEEYVDSDLENEDDKDAEIEGEGDGSGAESVKSSPPKGLRGKVLKRSDSLGSTGSGTVRASRSRAARGSTGDTTNPPGSAFGTSQNKSTQQSKSIPHFQQTIEWDLSSPSTPSPEEYAAQIAVQFGLSFPQTMDLKESIELQLDRFMRAQPQFYAPIAILDPYGTERPDAHFGPPEVHCGPVLNAAAAAAGGGGAGGGARPSVIRRMNSTASGASRRSAGGSASGASTSRSARPMGAVKPDRRGIHVVAPADVPKPASDTWSKEVLKRARATSNGMVLECVNREEPALDVVRNEVCHICHNRKELGLTFHCGKHTYCDMHCASRLSFRVKDYDSKNPTSLPIDYCPVCTLHCTCSKCKRRLETVAGTLKKECARQSCGVDTVVVENLYHLCSAKNPGKIERDSLPKAVSKPIKKKGSSKKVKIDENANDVLGGGVKPAAAGAKRGRSDAEDSRSTRSSPSLKAPSSSDTSSDGRPKKKRKTEKPAAPVAVLKVNPSEFPTEMYSNKDLDPSTSEDLNTFFTPDGAFPVDSAMGQQEVDNSESKASKKKYQDYIPLPPNDQHFFQCAVCSKDNEDEWVCCRKCPRSIHKKCFEADSARGDGVKASGNLSEGESSQKKTRECKWCDNDQQILSKEEVDSGMMAKDNKVQKAYGKYKQAEGYAYSIIILSQLLQILKKLMEYDYGYIFAEPVNVQVVPDYLQTIRKPMDYGTIISKLVKGGYSATEDGVLINGEEMEPMNSMEEVLLFAVMDVEQVHHNCALYNQKGSMYYRAGEVQNSKWKAYFNKYIRELLPDKVQTSLSKFLKHCEAERQEKIREQEKIRSRPFLVGNPDGKRSKSIAVFDPDTKRIVKQYTSRASARAAALMLHTAGYACEWEMTEANAKARVEAAEDPSKPLFGYQWVPTEKLRKGDFKVKPASPKDSLSPTLNKFVILKKDKVSGVQHGGFESEESAYKDWLKERSASFTARLDQDEGDAPNGGDDGGNQHLSDFVKNYLNGDKTINGLVWIRVEPKPNKSTSTDVPMSQGMAEMEEEHPVKSEENP